MFSVYIQKNDLRNVFFFRNADFLGSERTVREHEVDRIVEDKELHKVNQLQIVWAFSLYYSKHDQVGYLISVLESGDQRAIEKLINDKVVQFMLIGSNHNWAANKEMHKRYPDDPNFSHMLCYIFINFNYKDKSLPDLEELQVVCLVQYYFVFEMYEKHWEVRSDDLCHSVCEFSQHEEWIDCDSGRRCSAAGS